MQTTHSTLSIGSQQYETPAFDGATLCKVCVQHISWLCSSSGTKKHNAEFILSKKGITQEEDNLSMLMYAAALMPLIQLQHAIKIACTSVLDQLSCLKSFI